MTRSPCGKDTAKKGSQVGIYSDPCSDPLSPARNSAGLQTACSAALARPWDPRAATRAVSLQHIVKAHPSKTNTRARLTLQRIIWQNGRLPDTQSSTRIILFRPIWRCNRQRPTPCARRQDAPAHRRWPGGRTPAVVGTKTPRHWEL